VFLSYEPAPQSPPPNSTASPYPVLALPDPLTTSTTVGNVTTPPAPVVVNVPATATIAQTSTTPATITGVYDGQVWSMSAGRSVYVDIGPNQETASVTNVSYNTTQGIGGTMTLQFSGTKSQHPRGCIIQFDAQPPPSTLPLSTAPAKLGNPGPQPQFNFRDPRYAPVVPFVARYN
jgi:hypothetical protein